MHPALLAWRRQRLAVVGMGLLLAACATVAPGLGQSRDTVLGLWGVPTSRYALPEGGERLEYATGPWGRTTWMIDLGPDGRVRGAEQVLDRRHFADFAARAPGLTRQAVQLELGRPGERKAVGWLGGELWSWRYPTNDCLWFQVSFDGQGRATGAGYNIDPACDAATDRE